MRHDRRPSGPLLAGALALSLIGTQTAHAKTFDVPCEDPALASVMSTVNTNGEEDVVWLAPSCVYALATALIVDDDSGFPVTIHGRSATISGSDQHTAIVVNPGSTLYLGGVTVSDGFSTGDGGAIQNLGALTLTDSTVSGSDAVRGGGIFNFDNGRLTLIRSTVSGNTTSGDGAGIHNRRGRLTLLDSTVSGNAVAGTSGNGGGLYSFGATARVTLTNSTFSGNSSRFGAGVFDDEGAMVVSQTTFSDNFIKDGGNGAGIYYRNYSGAGKLRLSNSIVANSLFEFGNGYECVRDPNFSAVATSGGNLIEDGSCDIPGVLSGDPLLAPLTGSPAHHPLLVGSKAIDAGGHVDCAGVDQRGEQRPLDGDDDGTAVCDLGAYERP